MPSYFPFTGEPYAPAMGIKPLEPAGWIDPDDALATDIVAKRAILDRHRDLVLRVDPDPRAAHETAAATAELLRILAAHLPTHHPSYYLPAPEGLHVVATGKTVSVVADASDGAPSLLARLSELIQEDVCLLSPTPSVRLAAGLVCFPSRWNIAEKIGLDASAIHAPVPGFTQTLAQPTSSFLERITPDRSFWRLNWTIHDSDQRFAPHAVAGRTDLNEENVLASTFLRIERQTLRRLPQSGFVAFTIRTYIDRLDGLVASADRRERLRRTLASMPDEAIAYKGMSTFIRPLLAALGRPSSPS